MAESNIVQKLLGMTLLGSEWVLWLLIILSIVSIAIMLERAVFYYKIRIDLADFTKSLNKFLIKKDWDEIKELCESSPSLESQMVLRGMEYQTKGPEAMEQSMNGYVAGQRQKLDQGLVVLGTLGNNAPFIGLFGTVIGIIKAFNDLASMPQGGPSVVMSGISEALVATAVGLMVAIPAVIAYNSFQRIVKSHMANSQAVKSLVLAQCESNK